MPWGFTQTRCGPKPVLDTRQPICNGFTLVELLFPDRRDWTRDDLPKRHRQESQRDSRGQDARLREVAGAIEWFPG
jgi:hypothetical protein